MQAEDLEDLPKQECARYKPRRSWADLQAEMQRRKEERRADLERARAREQLRRR